MNLPLWIVAIVLPVVFTGSGLLKELVPKDKLGHGRPGWAQDYSQTNIRLIGLAEILGAIGLVLPAVLHIAPILVPLVLSGWFSSWRLRRPCTPAATKPDECGGQPGADRPGHLRRLGPIWAVFAYAVIELSGVAVNPSGTWTAFDALRAGEIMKALIGPGTSFALGLDRHLQAHTSRRLLVVGRTATPTAKVPNYTRKCCRITQVTAWRITSAYCWKTPAMRQIPQGGIDDKHP